jgi:hypothetical protein
MSAQQRDDKPDDVDRLDAPNQQVVREDRSGPADEGSGGSSTPEPEPAPVSEPEPQEPDGEG